MIKIHTMAQKSDEWFEARDGMLSASEARPIGAGGAGLVTLCRKLARQKLNIASEGSKFHNKDMERGDRLEPIAIKAYGFAFGVNVVEVGGITNSKYQNVWVSPDGLIGDEGGCEVKARNDEKHFGLILGDKNEIPISQIQMSLLVSERKWWDFISYNPNFKRHPLFIKRIYPDGAYFRKLIEGFEMGNMRIEKFIKQYQEFNLKVS